jgi:tetratricopeptide (TPR) repeat protein
MGLFDKLFGRGPKSARDYWRRAGPRGENGDLDGAIADLNEAIRLDPELAEAYCDRGWRFFQKSMYDAAFADFNKTIEMNPNYALAYNNRGVACSQLRDFDSAITDWMKTLELQPDHPWAYGNLLQAHLDRGDAFRAKGNYDQAMADYNTARELDPNSPAPYYSRGIAYVDQRKYDEAIADFTKAIQFNKQWQYLFERGRAYCQNGQFQEAIADLTAASDGGADNQHVLLLIHLYRGKAYQAQKKHDRAIADFTDAIDMGVSDSEPYILRGASYAELDRHDQAIADFTQALRIQPTPEAYRGRAAAYSKKGQLAQAIDDYSELIALRPEEPSPYQLRAQAYRASGDDSKASLDDRKAQAALSLGQALERLQNSDWDQAIALATEGIHLDSSQPGAYVRRGIAHLGKGDPDRALGDFAHLLQELPSLAATKMALVCEKRAQACRALGKTGPTIRDSRRRMELHQAESKSGTKRPSARRVAARAMVLSAIVCRALLEEEHTAGIHEHAEGRAALLSWIEELGLEAELEPAELEFLATPVGRASQRQTIDGVWRKEGLGVLAWALGRFRIPRYDKPTDPDAVLPSLEFLSVNDAAALCESAGLRPAEEIGRFASHITLVSWRIRQFQLDPERVAPSVEFDVRGDSPVPARGARLRKPGGDGIGGSMDFAGYLRQHPRFKDYWLDHLRLIDGDLAIGDQGIAAAFPGEIHTCRSIAVERQIAAYWLEGDAATYSEVNPTTLLSGC